MDANAAAELLAAANRGEVGGEPGQAAPVAPSAPAAPASNQPDAGASASQGQPTEGATASDTFLEKLDPNALPPELVPYYRSMQGDYIRKTQEIAEQRKAIEGLDPVEARQALEFVQALNTDPQYALQVHQELSNALQAMGLTKAEADAQASQAVSDHQDDDFGPSVPPEVLQRLERTEQQLQSWQQEQEQARIMSELSRQEQVVKEAHPEWKQFDLDNVWTFAYQTGGDLMKAAEMWDGVKAQVMQELYSAKSSVPAGSPQSTGYAQAPPEPFKNLDQATNAAEELFRASFGA